MKVAAAEQMRKIDRDAEDILGIPGIILMENAGIKVYKHIAGIEGIERKRVCIICGKGNNGGDGFVAARHLSLISKNLVLYIIGDGSDIRGDALINYKIAVNMGLCIRKITCSEHLRELACDIQNSDVVVDAVFGTGVRGDVAGLYKEVIEVINESSKYVISIDIPSGIDSDTGKVLGVGVRAQKTVTFVLPKTGLYTYPGAYHAGEVIVEDISIPGSISDMQQIKVNLLEQKDISGFFRKRYNDTNKGTYGRAFIIGGSVNMMGAVTLCIKCALRCGAGLVEAGVPLCIKDSVAPLCLEAIVHGVEDKDGILSIGAKDTILEGLKKSTAFAFGPGLSKSADLFNILENIITQAGCPGVIDADGLNLLSQDVSLLNKAGNTLILTPHPGEMGRLTGKDTREVQGDRIGCARDLSVKYRVVTVLKGANTVVASPDGEIFINTTGNPGMAKGGSGDVLTGIIVSFLAQGMDPIDAAKAGVFIHGLAGDLASLKLGQYGMKASDIIDSIPCAIKEVTV